jgi:hypothetical protein
VHEPITVTSTSTSHPDIGLFTIVNQTFRHLLRSTLQQALPHQKLPCFLEFILAQWLYVKTRAHCGLNWWNF